MADISRTHRTQSHHRADPRLAQDLCGGPRRRPRRDARGRPRAVERRAAGHALRHQRPLHRPCARIDIMAGLPELRAEWIRGRGDVEEVAQREVRPEDNGQLGPDRSAASSPSLAYASASSARVRAITSPRCTTPAAASSRPKWNMSRSARISAARNLLRHPRRRGLRRVDPRFRHPRIRPRRGRARPRHHPQQHQPSRIRTDGDRPQFPGQDQRQYRQQRGRVRRRGRGRQDGVGDPLGRRHGHGPLDRAQHPRHPRMDRPQLARADRHRPDLPGAREGRRRRRGPQLGGLSRYADRAGRAGRRLLHHPRRRPPALRPADRQASHRDRQPRRLDHGQMVPRPPPRELPLRALRRDLRDHEGVRHRLQPRRRPPPRQHRRRQ